MPHSRLQGHRCFLFSSWLRCMLKIRRAPKCNSYSHTLPPEHKLLQDMASVSTADLIYRNIASARRKTILWQFVPFPSQPDSSGVETRRYSCAAFFATLMHASRLAFFTIRGLASIQNESCSEELARTPGAQIDAYTPCELDCPGVSKHCTSKPARS